MNLNLEKSINDFNKIIRVIGIITLLTLFYQTAQDGKKEKRAPGIKIDSD